jgi:hypothetical protein
MPIPIVNQLVNTRQHVTSGGIGMNYNNNNVNNTNNVNNDKQFRSSSLGSSNVRYGGGKIQRPRAVSDFIITDYQSTSPNMIRPNNNSSINPGGTLPTIISQRAMSGLSLAMMNQEEVVFEGGINQHQQPRQNNVDIPPPPPPPNDDEEWSSSVLPYGSSSTRRVAFHTPAPTADNDEQQLRVRSYSERGEGGMTSHFYHKHGGYGYGYNNGSNTAAANAPPSPITRRPSDVYGTSGTLVRPTSTTPPLPTLLINRNSSGSIRSRGGSIGGTPPPPTSFLAGSRQHSAARTVSSSLADSSNSNKKNHHHRSSSSSSSIAQLSSFLSPITSLDMLQTSPFSASHVQRKSTIATTSNNNLDGGSLLSSSHHPLMLGMHQHQDEMTVFLKSIPRMVPSSSSSMEERCCNTINNNNNNNCTIASQTIQQTESEELQFTVDIPNPTSSTTTTTTTKSPKQQRSLPKSSVDDTTTSQSLLWGGTIEGTISGPSSDMANTLAVSSLAHRCATDGKIRLKMFDKNNNVATKNGGGGATTTAMETSVTTTTGGDVIGGGGVNGGNNNNNNAYHPAHRTHDPQLSSIEDQLSDFRSFGISLK